MSESYGDRFENMTIVAMCVLIAVSVLAVVSLQVVTHQDCTPNHFTYCGDQY